MEKGSPNTPKVSTEKRLRNFLLSKTRRLGIPIRAYLELTAKCNFNCLHCFFSPLFSRNKKEMTTNEFFSVLDQLADIGTFYLDITGGEPLIRPDFWKIIEHARKREFAITLYTNGSLITEEAAQRLADLFLYRIVVSIYGMSEGVYKTVTGASHTFKKAMHGLELLTKKEVNLYVGVVLMRENFFQLRTFENFLKKIGVEYGFVWEFHPCIDGSQTPLRHMLTLSQIEKLLHLHPELSQPAMDPTFDASEALCFEGGHDNVEISCDGEVKPCRFLENHVNIREKPIREILKKDPFFMRIRGLRFRHLPRQCLKCKAITFCRPCPFRLFLHTGSITPQAVTTMCKIPWIKKRINDRLLSKG